jgi:hypothetical protein
MLPVGLQLIECELFVGNPSPSQQELRLEYRINSELYPTLASRQFITGDAILHKDGKPARMGSVEHWHRELAIFFQILFDFSDVTCTRRQTTEQRACSFTRHAATLAAPSRCQPQVHLFQRTR